MFSALTSEMEKLGLRDQCCDLSNYSNSGPIIQLLSLVRGSVLSHHWSSTADRGTSRVQIFCLSIEPVTNCQLFQLCCSLWWQSAADSDLTRKTTKVALKNLYHLFWNLEFLVVYFQLRVYLQAGSAIEISWWRFSRVTDQCDHCYVIDVCTVFDYILDALMIVISVMSLMPVTSVMYDVYECHWSQWYLLKQQ